MASSASSQRKRVVLLGATGSIGENTLRVIAAHRDRLELVGIAARGNWPRLAAIAGDFSVRHVAVFEFRPVYFASSLLDITAIGVKHRDWQRYAHHKRLVATIPEIAHADIQTRVGNGISLF